MTCFATITCMNPDISTRVVVSILIMAIVKIIRLE